LRLEIPIIILIIRYDLISGLRPIVPAFPPGRRPYPLTELYALRAGSRPVSHTGWERGRRPVGAKSPTCCWD